MNASEARSIVNSKIQQAEASPNKPIRIRGGYYVISTYRGLVEIELGDSGWLARSWDSGQGWAACWMNDPVPTLWMAVEDVTTEVAL